MNLTNLTHDIIVYNIFIPFILSPTLSFKDTLQSSVKLSATSKYFKVLLEEPTHKTAIHKTLLHKLEDKNVLTIVDKVTNAQEAQRVLLDIAQGRGLFLDQYPKRNSEDFRYMNKFVVALLKQKGACINSGTTPDNSTLFITIENHDNSYFVEALLAHEAFPNQRNEHGLTPLMIARRHGKHEIYNILIKYGADRDMRDNFEHTVFSDIYSYY